MSILDTYDEEFNRYLNLAKTLITRLKSKEGKLFAKYNLYFRHIECHFRQRNLH